MECFAGLAASATVGHATFDYNRENFMYDRELRQKKELHMLKYRVCQSEQWRSDIRDLISLTEKKMHIYLLVNVLLLGFAVTLWCEGRLPAGTPPWMMLGQAISTAAAFMFLLLSIWFAMHAAVAAQSFEVRLLTQMVRLPIPSWQELEATRTYGSDFERVEARQMFRVPFLMGRQESLIPRPKPGPMRRALSASTAQAQASGAPAASPPASSAAAAAAADAAAEGGEPAQEFAADPWGLEGTGENIEELGCPHGSEVGKCRHVKLALKAAIHWQSYDAFARIAMSMGVNQLLLAIAYYLLGYVFVEVGVRSCAFLGVALLVLMQEALTRLDMSLNPLDLHLLQLLLFAGPVFMCLASYFWSKGTELGNDLAGSLIPFAFLMHGLYVLLMTRMCRIQEQGNGAMLPMALGSVLFLDVFGHMHNEDTDDAEDTFGLDAASRAASKAAASEAAMQDRAAAEAALESAGLGVIEEEEEEEGEASGSAAPPPPPCRPALKAIQYTRGRPKPVRLTDAAPPGAVPDMRNEPGAPSHLPTDGIDGDYYEPSKFFHEPELSPDEERVFTTGHEHEKPGIVPWNVFRTAMLLLWIAWLFGAIYAGLQAASIWSAEIPYNEEHEEVPLYDWIWDNHASSGEEVPVIDEDIPPPLPNVVPATEGEAEEPKAESKGAAKETFKAPLADKLAKPKPGVAMPLMTSKAKAEASMLQIARMGLHGLSVALGRSWEELEVTWPDGGLPVGPSPFLSLSCDAAGQQLAVSNGLLVWTADVSAHPQEERDSAAGLSRLRGSMTARQGRLNCSFAELRCPGFAGEALQDTALTCSAAASSTSQCTTWALHREGQKLTACDHHPAQAALPHRRSRRMNVSGSWLERVHVTDNVHSALAEMPETLTVDSISQEGGWSGFIGTNLGRIVRASQFNHETGSSIAPVDILHERHEDEREKSRSLQAGPIRSFNQRYIGMLNRKRQSLEVLDAEHGGEHVGRVALPAGLQASGFCAGGGFVYLVGAGQTPKLWRMSVPSKLQPMAV